MASRRLKGETASSVWSLFQNIVRELSLTPSRTWLGCRRVDAATSLLMTSEKLECGRWRRPRSFKLGPISRLHTVAKSLEMVAVPPSNLTKQNKGALRINRCTTVRATVP